MDSSTTDIAANRGKILVIANDPAAQQHIANLLLEDGFDVDISCGDHTRQLAYRQRPDLILINNKGSDQTSRTILEKIKSDPLLRGVQAILADPPQTATNGQPEPPGASSHGYFRHPPGERQLLARVRALMRNHEATKI